MKKRILASLTSLCLLVGVCPAAALAAEDGGTAETGDAAVVCVCMGPCTQEARDETCPVCAEDAALCAYTAPAAGQTVELLEDTAEAGTQGNPWDISAEGAGNHVTAYLEKNGGDDASPTYTLVISGSGAMADYAWDGKSTSAPWSTYANNITKLEIADEITYIGQFAFYNLKKLTGSPVFPKDLEGIGAYGYGKNDFTSVDWDAYPLTTIPTGLLDGSANYKGNGEGNTLVLPDKITSIGQAAFRGTGIEGALVLGENIQELVAGYVFQNTKITSVTFENPDCKLSKNCFASCADLTEVHLPDNLSDLPDSIFFSCTSLKSIDLGNVETVGSSAFQSSGIESVTGSSVKLIKNHAFSGSKLISASFPLVTEIQNNAFAAITTLTSADIPQAGMIGDNGFSGCSKLATVTTSNALTKVGDSAFFGCSVLTGGIDLSNVTEIGKGAFQNCSSLNDITPTTERLTSLGERAFQNCSLLAANMDLSGVTAIPNSAFNSCKELKQVKINPATTSVGDNAFFSCAALSGFLDFSNVTSVGFAAFTNCNALDGIYFGSLTSVKANSDGGKNSFTSTTIYVVNQTQGSLVSAAFGNPKGIVAVTNGGTFAPDTEFTSGTLAAPIKDGYTFGGWYSDSNFGTPVATLTAGQTYYARWVSKITFDGNGATSGSTTAQEITEGDATTRLTANSFGKTGYTFSGWNTAADGTGVEYDDQAAAPSASTTLYAQWTANTYTISFSGGSEASGSTASVTATYDQPVALTVNGFTKSGYKFAGWSQTENGTTIDFSDGAQVENLTETANGAVTLYAVWTQKEVLDPDVSVQTKTYNGAAQSFTLDGSYTISYQQNGQAVTPKDAGTYDVVISSKETGTTEAYKNTVYGGLVIHPAALTITADNQTIDVGGALPAAYTYTVSGLVGGDTESVITTRPTVTCSNADANTAGTYPITASGADAGKNYAITYVNGTLTVSRPSSGGSDTTTETTINPDGSRTTTVTDKRTGTVTKTTRYKDGSTLVVETRKDGAVTTTETRADGVKVRTVDEPGKDAAVSVTLPGGMKEAVVTIPAGVDYGMAAVNAGTGAVIKLSVPTEEGMAVKLDGSADLVLVDNAKDFTDTRDHWAEDAIDFASAHELFSGVSETAFAPDSSMTRAMLMTVLARFDGQDTAGGAWYEKGMAWAVSHGISDGSGPDDPITREQLVTMLWRYSDSPAASGSLEDYADGAAVSGYAAQAMAWAVNQGLISGMGDGSLAPQGSATRAQVAAILMRYVRDLVR